MTKRASIVVWGAVGVCAALLLLASTFGGRAVARPLGQVCEPPCWLETDCQVVGNEVRCQTHCTCPGGGTPGVTPIGTPFPWTPMPSPTPPPGGNVEWCLPYECAPGETRLWLVWYLYNLHIYQPVRPLEPCCGPSCPFDKLRAGPAGNRRTISSRAGRGSIRSAPSGEPRFRPASRPGTPTGFPIPAVWSRWARPSGPATRMAISPPTCPSPRSGGVQWTPGATTATAVATARARTTRPRQGQSASSGWA